MSHLKEHHLLRILKPFVSSMITYAVLAVILTRNIYLHINLINQLRLLHSEYIQNVSVHTTVLSHKKEKKKRPHRIVAFVLLATNLNVGLGMLIIHMHTYAIWPYVQTH